MVCVDFDLESCCIVQLVNLVQLYGRLPIIFELFRQPDNFLRQNGILLLLDPHLFFMNHAPLTLLLYIQLLLLLLDNLCQCDFE